MYISKQNYDLIRQFIFQNCGIFVGDEKNYLIETRLSGLLNETQSKDFQDFYNKVQADKTGLLRDKIIDAITTHETMWFRDEKMWLMMETFILKTLLDELAAGKRKRIQIWSAACSSGQEPYTLAMLIDTLLQSNLDYRHINPKNIEILGTDISPHILYVAMAGRFTQLEMSRGMQEKYLKKYFTLEAHNTYLLNEKIRERVYFKKFNLQDNLLSLGSFDLIMCRNVAIYFSDTFKKDLFQRMTKILHRGSYFILGAAESLIGHSDAFNMNVFNGTTYYQLI